MKVAAAWVDDATALRFAQAFCPLGTEDDIARRSHALHADLIETVGASVVPNAAALLAG